MSQNLICKDTEEKIDALIAQMTVEEKIGQMTQGSASMVGAFGLSFSELLNMMLDKKITQEEFRKATSETKRD